MKENRFHPEQDFPGQYNSPNETLATEAAEIIFILVF